MNGHLLHILKEGAFRKESIVVACCFFFFWFKGKHVRCPDFDKSHTKDKLIISLVKKINIWVEYCSIFLGSLFGHPNWYTGYQRSLHTALPRIEPSGTTALTGYSCEDFPSRTTQRHLLLRKEEIWPNIWTEIPQD